MFKSPMNGTACANNTDVFVVWVTLFWKESCLFVNTYSIGAAFYDLLYMNHLERKIETLYSTWWDIICLICPSSFTLLIKIESMYATVLKRMGDMCTPFLRPFIRVFVIEMKLSLYHRSFQSQLRESHHYVFGCEVHGWYYIISLLIP